MEIRLLFDHREGLVRERTRFQNRLRWHLLELNPELEAKLLRVDLIRLAALTLAAARSAHHLRRHPHDPLARRDQRLLQVGDGEALDAVLDDRAGLQVAMRVATNIKRWISRG
jgi:hypothetical protein